MEIVFITGNKHKLEEARAILEPEHTVIAEHIDVDEIQSLDPREIIARKLEQARLHTTHTDTNTTILMVEDVSLWIGSAGLPGPLIKWFNKTLGREGMYEFSQVFGDEAKVECYIGLLLQNEKKPRFVVGTVEGKIVSQRGESGFGFDPIFEPRGHQKTYAEMDSTEKNACSHRKLALEKVKELLK